MNFDLSQLPETVEKILKAQRHIMLLCFLHFQVRALDLHINPSQRNATHYSAVLSQSTLPFLHIVYN